MKVKELKQFFNQQLFLGAPNTLFLPKALKEFSNAHWALWGKSITKRRMIKFWQEDNERHELQKVIDPMLAYKYEQIINDNNQIIAQIQKL